MKTSTFVVNAPMHFNHLECIFLLLNLTPFDLKRKYLWVLFADIIFDYLFREANSFPRKL